MMACSQGPLSLLKELRVSSHQIPSFGRIPNTSIQKKPLLIYHSAFHPGTSASVIEAHLRSVDVVEPQWRYTVCICQAFSFQSCNANCKMYSRCIGVARRRRLLGDKLTNHSTSHFHSTSHEVLCVAKGRAKLCFGHENNAERVETVVKEGDVMVVPAGVSHRLLDDMDGGFSMVGSYQRGYSWDMCYGKEGEEDKLKNIRSLGWFDRDPIYGDQGPVLDT